MRLADTTVVITGASSGLGRATALLAAEEGARVVNADVQRDPRSGGTPTDEHITESGGEATFVETDVTDIEEVNAVMDEAIDRFGNLDVVVNNAGRAESYAITDTDATNWRDTVELNLTGVYHGCLAAVKRLQRSGGGAIVNIGSVFGVVGAPNSASYSAAKGGVIALTRQVARDYAADGIRVNAVSPGFVDTPMLREDTHAGTIEFAERQTPMRRIGTSDEIAEAVVFLASDAASFVTGQNLVVDGGYGMA
ncbi:SDR family NAD(P)-dependent oxidoreductase [Halomarina halobia]|uniref:SDR family NAD(P)-dependent oxidoreductase n=1 Tax=Halomarina halobia TaxID=3033386 RepID=A0ABD6AEU5_9EURY|nr:SDR family NAD(P)-dependent oxidoreductase [Halomarina sp. PSR21]